MRAFFRWTSRIAVLSDKVVREISAECLDLLNLSQAAYASFQVVNSCCLELAHIVISTGYIDYYAVLCWHICTWTVECVFQQLSICVFVQCLHCRHRLLLGPNVASRHP